MQDKSQWDVIAHYLQVSCLYKHGDFLFIAMINNSDRSRQKSTHFPRPTTGGTMSEQ